MTQGVGAFSNQPMILDHEHGMLLVYEYMLFGAPRDQPGKISDDSEESLPGILEMKYIRSL